MSDDFDEDAHRDRREHGGAPARPDDDALAERTERERVEGGLEAYDPDDVPPATDTPPEADLTDSEQWQEERGTFRRQQAEGEQYPITEEQPYPPSHYDE